MNIPEGPEEAQVVELRETLRRFTEAERRRDAATADAEREAAAFDAEALRKAALLLIPPNAE